MRLSSVESVASIGLLVRWSFNVAAKGSMSRPGWQSTKGTDHPNAKLDPDKVRALRAASYGEELEALAVKFGIGKKYAEDVKRKRRWKSIKD